MSLEAIEDRYGVRIPSADTTFPSTGEKISELPPQNALDRLLKEDLRAIFAPAIADAQTSKLPKSVISSLPRDLPSQRAATTPNPALVMIVSVRDCTMPLRVSGDMKEGEVPAGMTCTRNHPNRLLKLIVTDGVVEMPLVELETTAMFTKRLPVPGEKLLLKSAVVKGGTVIIDEKTVQTVGGEARALLDEYNWMKLAATQEGDSVSEAPKLSSLVEAVTSQSGPVGQQQQQQQPRSGHQQQRFQDPNGNASSEHQQHQNQRGGGGNRGGRGGGRGRGGGGGQQHHHHHHHHHHQQQQQALAVPVPRGQGGGHHHHHHHDQQQQHHHGGNRGGGRGGNYQQHHHQHHHQHQHQHQHHRAPPPFAHHDQRSGAVSNHAFMDLDAAWS